jgi:ABC-2 type transport system ATP-binding protein
MQEVFLIKYSTMFEVRKINFIKGGCRILSGVTFSVSSGEVVALTGANGAGKTTLFKILAGIWMPSSGTSVFDGIDMIAEPVRYRRHLGWLGESAPVDEDLTVKAYLKYRAKLKGEQSRKIRHRVKEAMSMCGLVQFSDVLIGNLSRGLRKRVALADAILLRPRLLLLDDVFAGLDESARESVASMISSFKTFATVILSGHEREWFNRIDAKIMELKGGKVS